MVDFLLVISILITILCLIPFYTVAKQYYITRLSEYLIFSAVFMTAAISSTLASFTLSINKLWVFQLTAILLNLLHYLILIHAIRSHDGILSKLFFGIGSLWFYTMLILILFWKILPNQPDNADVLIFRNLVHSNVDYHPIGAGFVTSSGTYIYSTSHNLIEILFALFTMAVIFINYLQLIPATKNKNASRVKKLWLVVSILGFILHSSHLPGFPNNPLINILGLLILILIAIVTLVVPEFLLITSFQLLRASKLYQKVKKKQIKSKYAETAIISYLRQLPADIMEL